MSPIVAEFIGTAVLLLLGNGVVANVLLKETKGHESGWIVITTGWALAVFVAVSIASPYSGAHLNPAVTIALAIAGKFAWLKVVDYLAAQFLGAALGAILVWLFYLPHFQITKNPDKILACFSTSPAIRNWVYNFFSEALACFVLVFTIFYFSNAEIITTKSPIGLGSLGALPVALLVWAVGLSLGGTTGYAINPFRDLAPRLIHSLLPIKNKGISDWSYAWIPVLGPFLGGGLAALLFLFLK